MAAMLGGDEVADERRECPGQQARLALDHRDAASVLGGCAGRLQPDHAAADDHDAGLMLNGLAKAQRVLDVAQVLNFKARVFQRSKPARPRSGRDQQAIVGERTAI